MKNYKVDYLHNGYFEQLKTINTILFTPREIDIIACINNLRGRSKIASILNISPRTSETHVTNIKRKVNHLSREGIIDFVERSGQSQLIRQHYQNLLVQGEFNKQLKAISKIISKNSPSCYFFCLNEVGKHSIITTIYRHIKLAGVNIFFCKNEQIFDSKQSEHIIYLINNNLQHQSITLQNIKKLKQTSIQFTFLSIENISKKIIQELPAGTYINFLECQNYYLTILNLLKRLSLRIEIDKHMDQLEIYYRSIIKQPIVYQNNLPEELKSLKVDGNKQVNGVYNNNKITRTIFLLLLMSIAVIGYNKMISKKENSQTNNSFITTSLTAAQVASYIPDILSGYEIFIGRENWLHQINRALHRDNIVVISGQGGAGKSTLAIEYVKKHKQNKLVRFFYAESKTKLDQQYRELAQELSIKVDGQPAPLIMQLINNNLANMNAKTLFVFDNVDNYDEIKEYLVNLPKNSKAIITTRKPTSIINKPHIVLEDFTIKEAEEYLDTSLQKKFFNKAVIQKLIESVGTLPYDIKCLTAYLIDSPFIDSKTEPKQIANKIKNNLFNEFIISLDQNKQQTWKILQYIANLDPDFINIKIIEQLFCEDIERSYIALKNLSSLSLITIMNNKNGEAGVKIHRNLQKNILNSIKNYPNHSLDNKKLTANLLTTLNKLFPEIKRTQDQSWEFASSLHSHLEKLLSYPDLKKWRKSHQATLANLYYKLAQYYLRVSINYQLALNYATIALELRQGLIAGDKHELANVFNIVGIIYRRLGRVQEGLQFSQKSLQLRQVLYKFNSPDVADSLYNVGMAYKQLGDPKQGLKYLQMSLDLNRQLYPNNNDEVANSLNSAGMCHLDLGNFTTSIEYIKLGLKILTEQYPERHDRIAELQTNLAYNYNKLGNHEEALKHSRSSVERLYLSYPDAHPVAIYSLNDLGESLIRTNNIQQGIDVLHRALDLNKQFGMEQHFSAAWILHDLGWGYYKKGKYKTALKYAEKSLDLRKEIYKHRVNHYEIAHSLYSLGDINLALGDKIKSLDLYQKALIMYETLSLQHLPEFIEITAKINQLTRNST